MTVLVAKPAKGMAVELQAPFISSACQHICHQSSWEVQGAEVPLATACWPQLLF